jgi:glycosyltransferase involved in cell wall biosynthesis
VATTNGKRKKRILLLCRSVFGPRMSSPGIRTRHMAEVLAADVPDAEITLAIPPGSQPIGDPATLPYAVRHYTMTSLPRLLFSHDIIIANDYPPIAMVAFPFRKFLLDYYTIYLLEWMELSREMSASRRKRDAYLWGSRKRIVTQLTQADMLITANDRQKDYYVGAMIALGLIDPEAYDRDPGLHHLIEPAPHGVRPDPLHDDAGATGGHEGRPYEDDAAAGPTAAARSPVLKGVYAGIGKDDKLIIWNGGILQWYDPLTLLRALAIVKQKRGDVKLAFVGGAYPGLGSMGLGARYQEAVELAKELGLLNNTVFFDPTWVAYDRMKDYMREADLAVCTYFNNLETHFSLRTRFIDVFWGELPLICTQGDVFSDMVREKQLGVVVPQEDVGAVAAAIEKLVCDRDFYEQCRANIRENNAAMQWDVALRAIVNYCRDPRSSALPKWRRTLMLAGAWVEWTASRAAGMWVR